MTMGLQVFDEEGQSIFEVGTTYLRIVGTHTVAGASGRASVSNVSFTLPATVPSDETPVLFCPLLNMVPVTLKSISGRIYNFSVGVTRSGNTYTRQAVTFVYGYYA